jgi:uracil-DNA glycosylase family 4
MSDREKLTLAQVGAEVVACRACPRLTAWREQVAREKRAAYRAETYWGKPVPGFGDGAARLLICGLAPAAHGGNRTGRVFTDDRSGDWLYAALHRAGFANQPTSTHRGDGLELLDCYVAACVRCCPPANKPTTRERDACLGYLVRELRALPALRCVVCLGGFAWGGVLHALAETDDLPRPRPRFAHGGESRVGKYTLLGSYHPSQQKTFTGRLTAGMLDGVLRRAREVLSSCS